MKFSATHRFVAPFAVALASGCASLPEPVAAPNGQPLSIREHTETKQYTTKEQVGEVEYKNQNGDKVGSAAVYQNRLNTVQYQVWNAYQGNAKISDDDLYRIARDKQAEDEVRSKRESGVFLNRLGVGGIILGAVAAGAGYYLMSQQKPAETDATGQTTGGPSALPMALLYGGLVTVSVGSVLTWVGIAKAKREHPLDQNRAMQAADNYNGALANRSAVRTTSGTVR